MNNRRQYLRWATGFLGAVAASPLAAAARQYEPAKSVWRERALIGFGTTLWIKVGGDSADRLEAALDEVVREIRSIEQQMSLFNPDSALSRLNARGVLHQPDAQLLNVLKLSRQISRDSGGSFDVSMQPLWQVWSRAAATQSLPLARDVQQALRKVNWRAIEVSPWAVRLNLEGMGVSLNGIAQGYAADRVRSVLRSHRIQHALIDTGETLTLGQSPALAPWALGIEDAASKAGAPIDHLNNQVVVPGPVLVSDGRAIATSSDAHTAFSTDRRHHHIIDPATGYSPAYWSSVTVIADTCFMADALTKVFFMLPPSQVMARARRWKVDVVLQNKAGQWLASKGAQTLLTLGSAPLAGPVHRPDEAGSEAQFSC